MIPEPITLDGRTGLVSYVNAAWIPVTPEQATLAVVVFDDGGRGYYTVQSEPRAAGGSGSGNFGHEGRPGEVGGSGEGGGTTTGTPATRTSRAIATYKPSTQARQAIASASELDVTQAIGGVRTDDNDPFDTTVRDGGHFHGVEVKTLIDNTNDKITMHPESRDRKVSWGRSNHAATHTIVKDVRSEPARYYYRRGVGSFRISSMREVSRGDLAGLVRR